MTSRLGASFPCWMTMPLAHNYPGIFVAEEEKAKAFNAAKIVLNTLHFGEIEGLNARTFEAAGRGAFQIVDARPELAKFFKPDKEIVTLGTKKDLKENIDYYLHHPKERDQIADRSYVRDHREHTYEVRLRRLLHIVSGLKNEMY